MKPPAAHGFTYLGLMVVLALMALTAAAAATLWSVAERRERESELLFVGRAYRSALQRYLAASPHGPNDPPPAYPATLEPLLRDPRFVVPVRHLRQLYPDPLTGQPRWALVRDVRGGIVGIHSLSGAVPIKRAGFGPGEDLGGAKTYRDWVFSVQP